ncbi:EcsC family protein [Cryptosporangium minutisporangium]|uniref:EcsC protein family protein n=1 Tax=Cryptosporangium minutisporangium TaxID=113569 RepID=A0ABP6SY65_9ACTN
MDDIPRRPEPATPNPTRVLPADEAQPLNATKPLPVDEVPTVVQPAAPASTRVLPDAEASAGRSPVDRTPPAPPQSPAAPPIAPEAPAWGSGASTADAPGSPAARDTAPPAPPSAPSIPSAPPASEAARAAAPAAPFAASGPTPAGDTPAGPPPHTGGTLNGSAPVGEAPAAPGPTNGTAAPSAADGTSAPGSANGIPAPNSANGAAVPSATGGGAAPSAPAWGSAADAQTPAPQDPGTEMMAVPPASMGPDAAEATAGAGETPSAIPANLLARMKADPAHAPELLVMAAVEKFGPEAALWMARTRAAHPYVADHVWVPVIQTRFIRLSKYSGAAAGAAGAVGAVVDVGVLAWNQARMVLHIAAAFGYDPTHPDRAAELLVIRGLQTKLDAARTAIDVARRQQDAAALTKHLPTSVRNFGSGAGRAYSELAWQLTRMAGLAAVKKMAMKFVPFAGVPLGAMANSSATKKLAEQAIAYYTTHRPPIALPPGNSGS